VYFFSRAFFGTPENGWLLLPFLPSIFLLPFHSPASPLSRKKAQIIKVGAMLQKAIKHLIQDLKGY
jgi:hypothetical protein